MIVLNNFVCHKLVNVLRTQHKQHITHWSWCEGKKKKKTHKFILNACKGISCVLVFHQFCATICPNIFCNVRSFCFMLTVFLYLYCVSWCVFSYFWMFRVRCPNHLTARYPDFMSAVCMCVCSQKLYLLVDAYPNYVLFSFYLFISYFKLCIHMLTNWFRYKQHCTYYLFVDVIHFTRCGDVPTVVVVETTNEKPIRTCIRRVPNVFRFLSLSIFRSFFPSFYIKRITIDRPTDRPFNKIKTKKKNSFYHY